MVAKSLDAYKGCLYLPVTQENTHLHKVMLGGQTSLMSPIATIINDIYQHIKYNKGCNIRAKIPIE
jgi:hypothetical protein